MEPGGKDTQITQKHGNKKGTLEEWICMIKKSTVASKTKNQNGIIYESVAKKKGTAFKTSQL
ncbi:hypothetical protein T06_10007 [Trichinella sp. T6]|nr:hypothetical protein T06_10007 [Trichinella sp. T6]